MDDAIVRASREENRESPAEMTGLVRVHPFCAKHGKLKTHRNKPMRGWFCNECNNEKRQKWYQKDPRSVMLLSAKARANRDGLSFNLKREDIVIPDVCPVLGIPLYVGDRNQHDNAPSLDRKDSTQGYIKSNVVVISYRANRIKNDATIEELERVLAYSKQ
jgi:hypothetical protein